MLAKRRIRLARIVCYEGKKPLAQLAEITPDYVDVEAVVPVMGNHLIDVTGPEFQRRPFTRSWIYGVYDGKVIFYEAMVARAYMLSEPNACLPIKAPKAVAASGYLSCRILRASQRDKGRVFSVDGKVLALRCQRPGNGSIEGIACVEAQASCLDPPRPTA